MARLMCIATHHKGGTIWIKQVVRALSQTLDVPWKGIWGDKRMRAVPSEGRAFLCNWDGYFPKPLWDSQETAFVHLIRDPRDVLLSGCRYHHDAPVVGEDFLHVPRDDLNGLTYQQHLNTLKTQEEKLLFEMMNKHAQTIAEMRAWPYGDPRSFELRYETLMEDTEATVFSAALTHLGLAPFEVALGAEEFWHHSLFGGLARPGARKGRLSHHIKAGHPRRWARELPLAVGRAYAERFGADLIALGYETDNAWVDTLPEGAAFVVPQPKPGAMPPSLQP
ncbi:MAG: hypothetical protein WCC57_01205 [Paracoccaceae bacterium]